MPTWGMDTNIVLRVYKKRLEMQNFVPIFF